MNAIRVERAGGPEQLVPVEVPKPNPGLPVQPESGVYEVTITAINDIGSRTMDTQYVIVGYEEYESQKQDEAKTISDLMDQSAVDLEINQTVDPKKGVRATIRKDIVSVNSLLT